MSPTLIKLAVLIAILVTVFTKLFWITLTIGVCWVAWKVFESSDTYKKYSE